jgi:PAS domain S-box-containing protein
MPRLSLTALNSIRHLVITFIIGCVLLIGFSSILYHQYFFARRTSDQALHNYDVLRVIRVILIDLLNMETGVRGYLVIGERQSLQPYYEARVWIDSDMQQLGNLVHDDPNLNQQAEILLHEVRQFRALLENEGTMLEHGGRGFTRRTLEEQKDAMDHLRQSIQGFTLPVQNDLQAQIEALKKKQAEFLFTLIAGSGAVVLAMWVALLTILTLSSRNNKAAAEAMAAEERFRMVMNGINDGLFDYDLLRNNIYFSPAYKAMLGYTDEEFPNTLENLNEHLHPEDYDKKWNLIHQYQYQEVPNYSNYFRMKHKDGSWRWILSRGIGIWDKDGKLIRLIGTHTDVTEQKDREEKLKELNSELESFAYIASHDLRSPLVNLKGFAGEMEHTINTIRPLLEKAETSLPEAEKKILQQSFEQDIPEALRFIHKSVDKMESLTSAVLDLSRIGRRELVWEAVNLHEIATRCADTLAYERANKNAEIRLENLPVIISDTRALEQILSNLMDNALKYLDPERKGVITVSSEIKNSEIIIAVKDNGRGINEADKDKVFEIFRRARNAGDERGMGMGLAYVKGVLRRIGGSIWFESQLGEGTTFFVRLPLRSAKIPDMQERAA